MTVYGLTAKQHSEVGRLIAGSRTETVVPAPSGNLPQYPGAVRIIAMTDREYDPQTAERLPVFIRDTTRNLWTVEQIGAAVSGYIVLTINGTDYTLECRRETLTDLKRQVPGLIRANVLPGLWELEFRSGLPVTIDWRPINTDENTTLCALFDNATDVIYTGSMTIREDCWTTVDNAAEASGLDSIDVVDAIPYSIGSVEAGAIGLAAFCWQAGFLVHGWQCRSWSAASGYSQDDDPVPLTGAGNV